MSKCVKCGNRSFKIQRKEPIGSRFAVYFVQCSMCGIPVGVLEYANSAALIEKLEKKIDKMADEVQQIGHDVTTIKNQIRR